MATPTTAVVLIGNLTVHVPAGTPHTLFPHKMDSVIRHQCRMLLARQPHWITETELVQDDFCGFYPRSWDEARISDDFSARFNIIQGADLLHYGESAASITSTPSSPAPDTTSSSTSNLPVTGAIPMSPSVHSSASTLLNDNESGPFTQSTTPMPPMDESTAAKQPNDAPPSSKPIEEVASADAEEPIVIAPKVLKDPKRRGIVGKVKRFFARWTGRGRVRPST